MAGRAHLTPVRWWPALLIATLAHTAPIAILLAPRAQKPVVVPDGPPLALMLAPPTSTETPPTDAAIAAQPAQDAGQPAVVPDHPPKVAEGPKGTLVIEKPKPDVPPTTRAVAVSSVAAAPPPPVPAPPAPQVAAPVEGAASQAQAAVASWESQIAARLEKAKRFPLTARIANEEDTVVVSFVIDAQGRTSQARIRRSAGYDDLEAEVLSLIARISPLPSPPDRRTRKMSVPIEFRVQR